MLNSPRLVGRRPLSLPVFADDDPALDRQFHCRESERFPCHRLAHPVNLEHDAAGMNAGGPVLDRALALAHANLGRLLADRDIREDPDPHATLTLHVARHGTTCRLDLARGDTLGLGRLQPISAEVQIIAALGLALDAALVHLAKFRAPWLQHLLYSFATGLSARRRARDHARPGGRRLPAFRTDADHGPADHVP